MSYSANAARKLEERVAMVTGASSGLGRATAVALARAGADVALLARSEEDLEEVAAELESSGRNALALPVDLAREDQISDAVRRTIDTFARVDVLVNAAGTDVPGAVVDLDVEGWDRTLAVNLRAPFLLSKAVFPHMREAGGGTIVNISSVAGKKGWANASAYCASKVRPHRLYPGFSRRRQGARHPGLRTVSRRDGDQLGRLLA